MPTFVEINTGGGPDTYVLIDLERVFLVRVKKDAAAAITERVTAVLDNGSEYEFRGESAADFLDRFRSFTHAKP